MVPRTKTPLFWIGLIFSVCIGLPLLLWGIGSVLGWLGDTYGIWFGSRNV
jgi:hypothetical protein